MASLTPSGGMGWLLPQQGLSCDNLVEATLVTADGRHDGEDGGSADGGSGLRRYGHSKDHRGDLPQITIGLAVTRAGIPARVSCWPNAVAFTVADAGSLERSRDTVSLRRFRASSSDTSFRAA